MASYHCSIKTTSRSTGGSAVAHAAYRSGDCLTDTETGTMHDYSRKSGIISAEIFLPGGAPEAMQNRGQLWNAATKSETRKNSTLVREMELALPNELAADERAELLRTICLELVEMHGVAVDAAEHVPHRDDNGNAHAHISMTTRRLTAEGFTEKAREWDDKKLTKWQGKEYGCSAVEYWRERVATLTNQALELAGHAERVDHRTLEAQGIDRVALPHVPREAWQIVKAGGQSDVYDAIMAKYQEQCAERSTIKVLDADIAQWTHELDALVKRAADEAKSAQVQAEAVAKAKRPPTRQELEGELAPMVAKLRTAQEVIDEGNRRRATAKPLKAVRDAEKALPALSKRARQAQAKAKAKANELESLPWWRPLRRRELKRDLPQAQRLAAKLADELAKVQALARATPIETLETVVAQNKALQAELAPKCWPLERQLATLEAQEAAVSAARDAIEARAMAKVQEAAKARQRAEYAAFVAEARARPKPKKQQQSRDQDYPRPRG
jgi:hypothetical protein